MPGREHGNERRAFRRRAVDLGRRAVLHGAAGIEATLKQMDVKALGEGLALNLVGILIKNRYYEDYGIDFLARVLPVYPHGHADLERMYRYYEMEAVEWAVSGVEGRHRERLTALGQVGRVGGVGDKPRWKGFGW